MIIEKLEDGYVIYKCDRCGKKNKIKYNSLVSRKRLDKQYCRKCSIVVNKSVEKRKKSCKDKYGVDNPMKDESISKKKTKNCTYHRNDIDDIRREFESEGYTLLTSEYKNNKQKLEFICSEGHRDSISYNSWSNGRRCNTCGYRRSSEKNKHDINFVRECLEKEGYTLLSDTYINKYIPIKYKCQKGHEGYVSFGNWLNNNTRCSSCSHIVSNAELELFDFIKQYFDDIENRNRTIIKPLELDIVIPSKKIAIEYCGLYWHSELSGKSKYYHLDKLERCNKEGYRLITIFEDEWLYKKDIVKNMLLNILDKSDSKSVYARNCKIKEINSAAKNKFLDKFHIQGEDRATIKLGAFYKDNLIAVMTFNHGSIAKCNVSDGYELSRFCTDYNYKIPGIASKLLTYFKRNYNPISIFSYADRRWSEGDLYYKIGFDFTHYSEPNYWYIVGDNRKHRFNFRKSQLKDFSNYDPSLSEWKIMKKEGFDRIWDCGNIRFDI